MSPLSTIAHYRITAKLGEGGMGAVYRATDTKLNRDVAIKVLPDSFAQDPDRLARFTREAQVLASLNHPNIAAIYGVEERALILELVEGPTLAERIAQGAIPADEALPIARQIAEALEYAHERGIVHRDLKPANVKVTPEGRVKVLDFGLAKAFDSDSSAANPASSPTLTMRSTVVGMIMGTAGYMSPEQAKGKPVDRRADIWAFGVLLIEMLTGRQLYTGETVSEMLASVIKDQPDIDRLPAATPATIRRLVRRCLDKDPLRRLQAIGEARIAIDETIAGPPDPEPAPAPLASRSSRLPWAAAGIFACLALAFGALWLLRPTEHPEPLKLTVLPPQNGAFAPSAPMLSPDGRRVLFTVTLDGKTQLWGRSINELEPHALPGTEEAIYPFWSPNSRFAGFFASGKLKKIDVNGGPPVPVCDASIGRGGSWNSKDVILFAPGPSSGLFRVPAAGGEPAPVTELDASAGEISHRVPWFLPDARHFLFLVRSSDMAKTGVYVGDLESKERRRIVPGSSNAIYAPPGFLLFARERTLLAQPFDASHLMTTGEAVPLADNVDIVENAAIGMFSASQTGVLTYYSGGVSRATRLTWFDRTGKPIGTVGQPGGMLSVSVSPDGGTVATDRQDPQTGGFDIWLHDLLHGIDSRFTSDPAGDYYPFWSPDGRYVLFSSTRHGNRRLYRKPAAGAGSPEVLLAPPNFFRGTDWSRDGRFLVFEVMSPKTGVDIWGVSGSEVSGPSGTSKPFPFLQSEFAETDGRLSPDARWLAYTSDQSKTPQVYVQSFPDRQAQWQISTNGGAKPVWSRDGKELFYRAADGELMAVRVTGGSMLEHSIPAVLFPTRLGTQGGNRFDVSPDGKRFLFIQPPEQPETQRLTIVTNWLAGVKE